MAAIFLAVIVGFVLGWAIGHDGAKNGIAEEISYFGCFVHGGVRYTILDEEEIK